MSSPNRNITINAQIDTARTSKTVFTSEGAVEYVCVNVTEVNGFDISGTAFQFSLGTYDAPGGTWLNFDRQYPLSALSDSLLSLDFLVGGTNLIPAGPRLYVWLRSTDHPEIGIVLCRNAPVQTDGPPGGVTPPNPGTGITFAFNTDGTLAVYGGTVDGDGDLVLSGGGYTQQSDGSLLLTQEVSQ